MNAIEKSEIEDNFKKWNIPRPQQDYMVVIHCSTYNHGKYIEDALKGFVMQQTNFPFCAIVIDDGSTDNAPEIIRRYAELYPENIKPILLGENHMQHGKSRDPYFKEWWSVAKYIAMCEGDDYWTDPLKLQKQVDFLEGHDDYVMCCHRYKIYDVSIAEYKQDYVADLFEKNAEGITFSYVDNLNRWITKTMTVVYRKETISEWQSKSKVYKYSCDVHTNYHLLKNGLGYCMPEVMAVCRFHSGGVFSSLDKEHKMRANALKYSELSLNNKDDVALRDAVDKVIYSFFHSVVLKNASIRKLNYADIGLCLGYYRKMHGFRYALGSFVFLMKTYIKGVDKK